MSNLAAIKRRRADIARQIERLHDEDEKLSIAEQVLSGLDAQPGEEPAALPIKFRRAENRVARTPGAPRFHRDFVLDALAHSDGVWIRSGDVVDLVKKRWGAEIPERSLRPLLSLMKNDGLIVRQGRLLAHPSRCQNGLGKRERPSEGRGRRAAP